MPAFLTHWRILIETARSSQDAGHDLGSLIVDADTRRRRAHGWSTPPQTTATGAVWDTGPLPQIGFRLPGSDISAMAFLGALAPDAMYYHRHSLREKLADAPLRSPQIDTAPGHSPAGWSDLFHRSHTGDLPILFLEQVALVPSPALRSQALAFAMGYLSHIATDLALNPWLSELAPRLSPRRAPGPHCSGELLLDEYLAATYFAHPRYNFWRQPWEDYIAPAVRNLSQPDTPTAQLPQLLASAATEVYQLPEQQATTLPATFLASLDGLSRFLAGSGTARRLTLRASRKTISSDELHTQLSSSSTDGKIITPARILAYAIELSVHLCQRAISYYSALRDPQSEGSERSARRAALVNDLRNWDLYTGHLASTDDSATAPLDLDSRTHFAEFWEKAIASPDQSDKLITQPG